MLSDLSRKDFLKSLVIGAATAALPASLLGEGNGPSAPTLSLDDLRGFEKISGLSFTDEELKEVLASVNDFLAGYQVVRAQPIDEHSRPPTIFTPRSTRPIIGKMGVSARVSNVSGLARPKNDDDLAFLSVRELGYLVKSKQVSALELTELSIARLQRYGDKLLCVVTLLPEQARGRARELDRELQEGRYRGPLHGIPCGIKDLFAFKGAPTTWGAAPYQAQQFDYDAAVVDRLNSAGAIIVAKLSMGALAMGDVWFKGTTKNPWNPKQGSSGSSAGSASATAAGLVPFAIGTETLGSICSPSSVCRVTGLRPTYGRVSRYGAMDLSYTMDKIGPICRQVEDCALVFAAIAGHDPRDPSSVDRPFHFRSDVDLSKVKIGYAIAAKDDLNDLSRLTKDDYLKTLLKLGANPRPVKFTPCPNGIVTVLDVEAGSAFDAFTRSPRIADLKNSGWPGIFRSSRFVPAVEYLQAMRARSLLMDRFEHEFGDFDMVVAGGSGGNLLVTTNLTGHPQVLIPHGTNENGGSRSVSFIGRIYEEDRLLAVANAFQREAGFYKLRPDLLKI